MSYNKYLLKSCASDQNNTKQKNWRDKKSAKRKGRLMSDDFPNPVSPETEAAAKQIFGELFPDKDFQRFFEKSQLLACHAADNNAESITPTLVVVVKDKDHDEPQAVICSLAVPFNEAADKQAVMSALGQRFYQQGHRPLCAFLIAEAWTAEMKGDEADKLEPRHRDDRKEVAICVGSTIDGRTKFAMGRIDRGVDDKIVRIQMESHDSTETRPTLLAYFYVGYASAIFSNLVSKGR